MANNHIPVLGCHFSLLLLRLVRVSVIVHSELYLVEKVGGRLRGPAGWASDQKGMV